MKIPTQDERLLEQNLADKNSAGLFVTVLLAAILVPAFWILDWFIIPEHVWLTAILRSFVALYGAFVGFMFRRHRAWVVENEGWLGPSVILLVGWSIAVMCWLHDGYESNYYAGLNLTVLGAGTLFLWDRRKALWVYLAVYGFYMAPAVIGAIAVKEPGTALNNQFFFLATIVIVIASQQHRYNLECRQFLANLTVERTKNSLEEALAKLKELDRMKSQFFSNITHELRTPLTMILSPLESMIQGELGEFDKSQRTYLQPIWKSALKLLKLINDLLDLAKLEERFLRLRLESTDLHGLLQEITEHAQPLAARKDIDLSLDLRTTPQDLWVDIEKMERVVVNLISNALKFTEIGGRVVLRLEEADEEVRLSVQDTGVGIPEDKLGTIFERFSQADGSVTRRFGGTGIGLAFAREIVDLHGGRISVASEPGKGSTFVIHLRRGTDHVDPSVLDRRKESVPKASGRRSEDQEPREWARALIERSDYRFLGLHEATERRLVERGNDADKSTKIVVVEDNPEILSFLHLQLQASHAVYLAKNGVLGLDLIRRERPDVVVTDYMMPEMDGLSMIGALREKPSTADIPVIMLTAKNRIEDRLDARARGADVYLTKPFSPRELRAAIDQLLTRRGRQATKLMRAEVRSLETISAGLAHEINNPLSYIKNAYVVVADSTRKIAATVQDDTLSAEDRGRLVGKARARIDRMNATIQRGILRIEQIVALVRRYAREGYPKEITPLSIDLAVADVLALISPKGEISVGIETKLDAEGGCVACIPEEMHQVIRNLVQNAVDAVGDGGHVEVRTSATPDALTLEVIDDGPGIPREQIARIFTPFFTTKAPGQGMGLGLAIVQQVVRDAGGRVQVDSTPGAGTTFTVILPRTKAEAEVA